MGLVVLILNMVIWFIVVDALLSWFQKPEQMPRKLTSQLTEKLYTPIHAIVDPKKTNGIDLSPIIVIVSLQLLIRVLS